MEVKEAVRFHQLSIDDWRSERRFSRWFAALGATNAILPQRRLSIALRFFQLHMPGISVEDAFCFCKAIDLSRPTNSVILTPSDNIIAFRLPGECEFKLFYTRAGQSRFTSGINPSNRRCVRYLVMNPAVALESYTASAVDTWTRRLPGEVPTTVAGHLMTLGYMATGGGLQLLIPNAARHLTISRIGRQDRLGKF